MHPVFRHAALAAAFLYLVGAAAAQETEEKPLFELGVLGAGGIFPDYPGSNQSHAHAIPVPYLIYRGEYLQLAPASARGVFVNTPAVSVDLSASGAFRSAHNDSARVGMPGLDYLAQVGPRVNVLLAHDAAYAKIDLEIPVRAVFSTNLSNLAYRGFLLAPELAYTHSNFMGTGGRLKLGISPEFATTRLMDYFYQVEPQFVIPGRPAYEAHGGYLGTRGELSYRYPLNQRITIIGFADPELYKGNANEASPLFRRSYGISAGLAVAFSFWKSEATTSVPTAE